MQFPWEHTRSLCCCCTIVRTTNKNMKKQLTVHRKMSECGPYSLVTKQKKIAKVFDSFIKSISRRAVTGYTIVERDNLCGPARQNRNANRKHPVKLSGPQMLHMAWFVHLHLILLVVVPTLRRRTSRNLSTDRDDQCFVWNPVERTSTEYFTQPR